MRRDKMQRGLVLSLLSIWLCLCTMVPGRAVAAGATPEEVLTASRLVAEVRAHDGQRVILEGEVIGSLLPRGTYVWANVGDGVTAVGVWMPRAWAGQIRYRGAYATQGDRVRVEGVFHAACPQHGGDADLHADAVTLVERGHHRLPVVPAWRWWVGGATLLAGAGLALVALRPSRRE